jgi:hypothetical protein
MASEEELREVKRRHSMELLGQPGVVGVGIERDAGGEFSLAVHLASDDPDVRKRLPQDLEGHPIRFVITGRFRKFRG